MALLTVSHDACVFVWYVWVVDRRPPGLTSRMIYLRAEWGGSELVLVLVLGAAKTSESGSEYQMLID